MTTVRTHAAAGFRPDRRMLAGLAWRAALVALAALVAALGLTAWVRTPLSAAAGVVLVAYAVQRYRRRGLVHTVLVSVGALVVSLALLGVVLNVLPWGITAASWAVSTGLLELAALAALTWLRPPVPRSADALRPTVAGVAWGAAVVLALGGAVLWATASFTATHVEPLAVAAQQDGSAFTVTVSSGTAQGPYRLDLVTAEGRTTVATGLRVTADHDATARVRLPAATRGLLQLVPAGGGTAVRELILDTTAGAS